MPINERQCNNGAKNLSPWEEASFVSCLCFAWAFPLLRRGFRRPLQESDLPALARVDTSLYNVQHLKRIRKENPSSSSCLAWVLFQDYWRRTRKARLLLAMNMTCRIIQAIALGRLLEQFQENVNHKEAYVWTAVLAICGLLAFPAKQHMFFETYRIGMQYKVALVAAIFEKTLQLPANGNMVTSGQLTNLASNDVERFLTTSVAANFIVMGPLEAIIILAVGMSLLGPAFAAGYALILLLIPLQFFLSRRFAHYRGRVAALTDQRVSLVSQAVTGARVVKMNAWELEFEKRILRIRHNEVALLQKSSRLKGWNEAIYYVASVTVSVLVFVVHVATGGTLSPQNVFATFTLLNIVQFTLTKHIPNAVMGLSECQVSARRIQTFLDLPEQPEHATTSPCQNQPQGLREETSRELQATLIATNNMTCVWHSQSRATGDYLAKDTGKSSASGKDTSSPDKIALANVTLELCAGNFYCVIGKVGAGKSALLQALAGELHVLSGGVNRWYESMGYATQDAWIMDGTVRENIIMGLPFKEEWYRRVVNSCALQPDIQAFVHGDKTVVGDRGVQCSGGQRARIALARALYCDAQIVLLDDPLSAVDANVARTIYNTGIRDLCIKRGKCVVLVTHQHQFALEADACILLEDGRIIHQGLPADFPSISLARDSSMIFGSYQQSLACSPHYVDPLNDLDSDPLANTEVAKNTSENAEKKQTGVVRLNTWASYSIATGGAIPCALFILSFTVTQASLLVTIVMVGKWAEVKGEEQSSTQWFLLMAFLTLGLVVLAACRSWLSFYLFIKASERLQKRMLRSVLRAKIVFFDTNPVGRILNRFSADVGISDEILPLTIYDFLVGLFFFLGGVGTAIVVLPFVLLTLPPLAWSFVHLRRIFVATTRELKRLEGLARSPIYTMFSETLEGIVSIRRNEKVRYLQSKFERLHDAHTRAHFSFIASSRWFAMALDSLAFALMAESSFLAVLFHSQGWFAIDPAVLGLALTMLIQLATTNFPWMVRQSAEVTNQMVSVERIVAFSSIESEAALTTTSDDNEYTNWPQTNAIKVENLAARYRSNLRPCLSGINFNIAAGQRVGVVGRTGSGKTSLLQVLFRLLEAESGRILIDGVDISKLGLHKLRKAIAVIPQSPVLFSGCTIRENMDPFGQFQDDAIADVLEKVQMKETIHQLPSGLDTIVEEGGGNFSNGQRQLLCLARALLLRTKLLVLDEPTASVDRHTDNVLQETIRQSFSDSTILSIAHRLETVIDYDRILVLQYGKVLEFGDPATLLAKEDGHFTEMVRSTGEAMSALLRQKVLGLCQPR